MQHFEELVKGVMVSCDVRRTDHRKLLGDDGTPDCLVQYDPVLGIVTVDYRASDEYAKWAGIHEAICCGKFSDLVPAGDDPIGRCARIDELVMAIMPATYRLKYSRKRYEMFGFLIERGFSSELRESFERSLAFHRDYLKKEGGDA